MRSVRRTVQTTLGVALFLTAGSQAWAQTATVSLSTQKQYIRGFGGMNHPVWAGDLTAAQRTTAFGNADGQLGFSALRMWVSDNTNQWSQDVATAKAALANGAIVFATPWNPPASMKSGGSINTAQFAAYRDHLNSFVSYMKGQSVDLYAIAVQNEPDYASEWTAWTPAQCRDFIANYGASITTRLISCESFNYSKSYYDPILNDATALANMDILGTHLYGTPVSGFPYANFDSKGTGKERWMTEHYTDSTTDADSWPNALNVATELHNSMVQGQFSLYTWWYIRRSYGPIKENGAISKRGWCMAHWSKFVRPGYYRVDATATPTAGLYVSAYKGTSDVVIVVVNTNTATKPLTITVSGSDVASYDRYTTSGSKSLAKEAAVAASNGSLSVTLDAQSVTTLRGSGTTPASGGSTGAGGAGAGGAGVGGRTGLGGATAANGGTTAAGGRSSAVGGATAGGSTAAGGKASSGGNQAAGGTAAGGKASAGGAPSNGGSTVGNGGAITANGGSATGVGGAVSATGGGVGVGGSSAQANGGSNVVASGGSNAQGGSLGAIGGATVIDGGSEDSGCSCTVAGAKSSNPMIAFALGALLWLRRRKQVGRSSGAAKGDLA